MPLHAPKSTHRPPKGRPRPDAQTAESHPTYRVYPPRRTQTVLVCPTCKVPVQVTHQFQTADGVTIATYHCREHGDVVPMRSALVNFIADQPQPV